jgi:predicted amidophosphoribosyltransferase
MGNPSMEQQLAAYVFIVNPIVCPKCFLRYPRGTKVCNVCGKELPKE